MIDGKQLSILARHEAYYYEDQVGRENVVIAKATFKALLDYVELAHSRLERTDAGSPTVPLEQS